MSVSGAHKLALGPSKFGFGAAEGLGVGSRPRRTRCAASRRVRNATTQPQSWRCRVERTTIRGGGLPTTSPELIERLASLFTGWSAPRCARIGAPQPTQLLTLDTDAPGAYQSRVGSTRERREYFVAAFSRCLRPLPSSGNQWVRGESWKFCYSQSERNVAPCH